ncbi:MAG: hypothetical protein GKS00_25910 [Alphaproteobacteria bacterium]|nr:hypothetical protein [Alphaproteobacteria bacterium]
MRNPEISYAEEIRRTPCGAVDDYYYYKIGRRIRSEAFHNFMKRQFRAMAALFEHDRTHEKIRAEWG